MFSRTNTSINDSPTPTGSSPGSLITASLNSSKTTHNTNVGAIAGGVVGGSVFLVLVGLFVVCCYRRRRHIAPEVTPFHPTRSTPIKEPPAQNIDHSDLKVLPTPSMSEEPPTTLNTVPEDLSSLIPRSSSESSRLREQLANLHAERDALRDRKSSSQLSPSHPSPSLPPSTGTPQTTEEIALLREEVAQLRARQDRDRGRDPSWASPVNQGLMLEVMALREELEEMRAQQELPRYSPPPPPFP